MSKIINALSLAGSVITRVLLGIVVLLVLGVLHIIILGMRLYTVQTGSMAPTYPVGTVLIVEPVQFEDLSAGDVITYTSGNAVVTHRIVSTDPEKRQFQTKGDNNNVTDSAPVSYDRVIGKVKTGIPYVGLALLFLQTRFGTMMLMIAIASVLVFTGFKWLYDRTEDDEEEVEAQNTERQIEVRHE